MVIQNAIYFHFHGQKRKLSDEMYHIYLNYLIIDLDSSIQIGRASFRYALHKDSWQLFYNVWQ